MISLYTLFESREDPKIYNNMAAFNRLKVKLHGGTPIIQPGLGFKRFQLQKGYHKIMNQKGHNFKPPTIIGDEK